MGVGRGPGSRAAGEGAEAVPTNHRPARPPGAGSGVSQSAPGRAEGHGHHPHPSGRTRAKALGRRTVRDEEWALRMLAVAFPLALADEYFGFKNAQGLRVVPLDQAHVFVAARTDLWDRWHQVPRSVKEMIGNYWHVRPGDVAERSRFYGLASHYADTA